MRKIFILLLLLTASSLLIASEYKLKSAYIYNIAKFVKWPEKTFITPDAPINIAIFGDDPFGVYIDALKGEKVGTHPIKISRTKNIEDINAFHILFISKSELSNMKKIRDKLSKKAILSISDMDDFVSLGGIIQLRTVKNRLKMIINMRTALSNHLQFSAKLLEIASLVEVEDGL